MNSASDDEKVVIPAEILKRCNTYKHWQLFWFVLHYSVGIGTVVAGGLATLAASQTDDIPKFIHDYSWLFGLVSGFFGSVVTFLRPLKIADTYKQAYYNLSAAILRYQVGNSSIRKLLNEFEESQKLVLQKDKDMLPKEEYESPK